MTVLIKNMIGECDQLALYFSHEPCRGNSSLIEIAKTIFDDNLQRRRVVDYYAPPQAYQTQKNNRRGFAADLDLNGFFGDEA